MSIIQHIGEEVLEHSTERKAYPVPKKDGGRDPQGKGNHERPIRASTGEADDPMQSRTLFRASSQARKKHRKMVRQSVPDQWGQTDVRLQIAEINEDMATFHDELKSLKLSGPRSLRHPMI